MKKRIVAMLLGLIMVVSTLAGCGSDSGQKGGETKTSTGAETSQDEIPLDKFAGTELTIAIAKNMQDGSESHNDKDIIKMAEEATGIHINWIEVDQGVVGERVDTMLSSDEMPDVFMGMIGTDQLAGNPELFYDMSDLLETYAPNVLKDYELGGQGILDMITLGDGSIRSLAGNLGSDAVSDPGSLWWINKAWLDKLGMEIPTTADEFYDVLCAFRDNDMNGNGDKTDEIPFSFSEANSRGLAHFGNAFGIVGTKNANWTHYVREIDGEIHTVVDTENYRAFLEYANMLAKEGLLDVEGFSHTYEQYHAKLAEGKVGVFIGWSPAGENCANPEEYVAMVPFQGIEGVEVRKTGYEGRVFANLTAFVPSADCSNIEAALHWWNYLASSVENKMLARFGAYYYDEEGVIREGHDPAKKEEGIDYTTIECTNALINVASPYLGSHDRVLAFNEADQRWVGWAVVESYMLHDEGSGLLGDRMVDPEIVNERVFIETDLLSLIDNFRATSVVEGVTDESWNEYLEDLKTYQYYEWIDWWKGYASGEY